jgi:hypothetical protein
LLSLFPWRNPQDAILMLGWLAVAPICGVLKWRPHCFAYGPPNCGKTTLHATVSNLLTPLVVSADGQSTEAGIRQLIKADSRPCVLDEFESDQARSHLAGVLRLARSASSAENPVLRGTPEGKAMHFVLRTCFFFAAVNPSGMSPADATRILLFEMVKHDNEPKIAQEIAKLEASLANKGPAWCGYMAGLAQVVPPAIEQFMKALPGIDSRHRLNIATLLAGAFVAKHRAVPSEAEAQAMAEAFLPSIELHAEAFERDDASECLEHLLAHQVEKNTLGYWIGVTLGSTRDVCGVANSTNARIPEKLPCPDNATPEERKSGCTKVETRSAASTVDAAMERGVLADAGVKNFAVHADISGRRASNYAIPGYLRRGPKTASSIIDARSKYRLIRRPARMRGVFQHVMAKSGEPEPIKPAGCIEPRARAA